jgi:ribonuclease R
LPSREFIIQTLGEHGIPMPFSDLVIALDIQEGEVPFFERRMFAMERDGQVMRNRRGDYLLPAKADLIRDGARPSRWLRFVHRGGGA